jgi:FkbM family methyltransferase
MSPFSWLKKRQVALKPEGFVIYGSMRTGSNYLVSLLNQFPGVVCHGEPFNPAFVGLRDDYYAKLGFTREQTSKRDADLECFYKRLMARDDQHLLCGFKLFPGHNAQIIEKTLRDQTLSKIILRRDLLTSFISLCQAESSGVWMIRDSDDAKLSASRKRSNVKIHFDGARFLRYRKKVSSFYRQVEEALRISHQPFLQLWYKDLGDSATTGRLADFLQADPPSTIEPDALLAKQNISSLHERVENFPEMIAFLESHSYLAPSVRPSKRLLKEQVNTGETTLNGIRLDLSSAAFSANMRDRIRTGRYERQEAHALKSIITPGEVIVELGGGIGYISSLAWKTGKAAKIIVVEANPETIPLIHKNHALNDVAAEVINGVAAPPQATQTTAPFFIRSDFWASSLSPQPYGFRSQVEVPIVDVQHLLSSHGCTLLICDIEGAEAELIPKLIFTNLSALILELHPKATGILAIRRLIKHLRKQGFTLSRHLSRGGVAVFTKLRGIPAA